MWTPDNPISAVRWLAVKNTEATLIPAYGCVRVTGAVEVENQTVIEVARPNADSQANCMLACLQDIQPLGYGIATYDTPAYALYDATLAGSGLPATGENWGAKNGHYKLARGNGGFRVIGNRIPAVTSNEGRVYVQGTPNAVAPSWGHLYGTVSQAAVAGFPVTAAFDNDGSAFSQGGTIANNSATPPANRIIVNPAGMYLVMVGFLWEGSAVGATASAVVIVNATQQVSIWRDTAYGSGVVFPVQWHHYLRLAVNDYMQIQLTAAGGNCTFTNRELSAMRIGA